MMSFYAKNYYDYYNENLTLEKKDICNKLGHNKMKSHSEPLENDPGFKHFHSSPAWRTEFILSFSCNSSLLCMAYNLICMITHNIYDANRRHISLSLMSQFWPCWFWTAT